MNKISRFLLPILLSSILVLSGCLSSGSRTESSEQINRNVAAQTSDNNSSSSEKNSSVSANRDASGTGEFTDSQTTARNANVNGNSASSVKITRENIGPDGKVISRDSFELASNADSKSGDDTKSEFGDRTFLSGNTSASTNKADRVDSSNISVRTSTKEEQEQSEKEESTESNTWFGIPWYLVLLFFLLAVAAVVAKVMFSGHSQLLRLGTLLSSMSMKDDVADKYKVILNQKDRNFIETLKNK